MKFGIRLRLTALGLAAGLMGALIVLVTLVLQHKAEETRTLLSQMDAESFGTADRFKDKLRHANDQMRRYASAREAAGWDEFVKANDELKSWIGQQATLLPASAEQEQLKLMGAAHQTYLQKARELHARMETSGEPSASLAEYNAFLEESRRFFDLGQKLAMIHYQARNDILAHTNQPLTGLRMSVLGLVGLLFVFGVALAGGVYRDLIAPLRVKLVESQALAERNEKLAAL